MSVSGIIANAWARIKHAFTDSQATSLAFVDTLATNIESLGAAGLTLIAQTVQDAEASTTETGAQKFMQVKSEVIPKLEAMAITFSMNTLHGAIEAAVAFIKSAATDLLAPAVTPAPTPAPTLAPAPSPAPSALAAISFDGR